MFRGPRQRICAISIDVDPIPCYYRIHGLGPAPVALRDLIMRRCVPRFAALFARRGIAATFFVVAEDVDRGTRGDAARAVRAEVAALARAGHEIASHSYSHPYELARLPRHRVVDELRRAHDLLGEVSGDAVLGFRAPGYDVSPVILQELVALGYRYDSSIFPAPGYYAAKLAIMTAMAAAGRPTGAVRTDPRALWAPASPYRPAVQAPWRRGDAPLWELPVAVTPWTRTPVIGTSLLLAPMWLRNHWLRAVHRRPFFNFELHGIDLADAEEDGIPGELVARQPDLRVPLARKWRALEAIVDRLALDYEFRRLRDVPDTMASRAS
jgi:peptidoglycan/xylan/chitin deacetylase (PgdA/CDA1 family)